MNTPAHLIFGAAAFGRPEKKGTGAAAILGGFAPDISLYVMVAVSIWVMGVPAQTVFREYYYSDAWQAVFAVDNSFLLWGALLAFALWRRWIRVIAFAGAGFLHLIFDFPLHTHDARQHFWPASDWVFVSPVSYWNSSAYAGVVGPVELILSLALAALVWARYRDWRMRGAMAVLLAMELMSSGIWRLIF